MIELGGGGVGGGRIARRGFLRFGSLGFAGFSLADWLRSQKNALGADASQRSRNPRSIILFWMAGGPSHLDMYDLKPDAPAEVRGPFRPIDTRLPGLQVCELMPRHAAIADRLAVVRSISHEHGNHDDASHWMQTGYPLLDARQRGQTHPCQGSVIAALRGANQTDMPPYVCIPEDYRRHLGFYQSAAYLSSRFNAVNAGGDPSLGNYRPPDFRLPEELTLDRLHDRRLLRQSFDQFRRTLGASEAYAALDDSYREAIDLITGRRAREAFDLAAEPDALKQRYGRHAYGQSALLARRLVQAGVTFVTINLYEKDVDWWDDHYTIEVNLRKRLPLYDQALAALIEDLDDRGMSQDVMVAAFGEFGRAPRIDAGAGRGHWPGAMAAVLCGGGIRGGQIVGSTTADGGRPLDRPLTPGCLLATMYHAIGVDPDQSLPDRQNRPVPLLPEGQPIRELVG
ncbi:MAG: DUF1501 domain-containing protein [Planctomycetes bacterium]|nr:DUF1501 domain-containing protein [Planctomycetota bacterium]